MSEDRRHYEFKRRQNIVRAMEMTPIGLRNHLIDAIGGDKELLEAVATEIHLNFLLPLTVEIERLRYRPDEAIPIEKPLPDEESPF